MPSTFNPTFDQSTWLNKQFELIDSLKKQPIVVLLRTTTSALNECNAQPLIILVESLLESGIKHIEIGWSPHPNWKSVVEETQKNFQEISFGAASINSMNALSTIQDLNFTYAMSPGWNPLVQEKAKSINQIVIPGVFSPSEILNAISFGWKIVKLFPASILGKSFLASLKSSIVDIPFIIAAGGLTIKDINPWIEEGYGALILGRKLFINDSLDLSLSELIKEKF